MALNEAMSTRAKLAAKKYHHGDLREVLLVACEAILQENGAAELSLREIARRANVSHAAPKHHFANLGELLGEVAARGFEQFTAALEEAADNANSQSSVERMVAMGRAYLRFAELNPALYGLMFGKSANCTFTPHLIAASHVAWVQLEEGASQIVGSARSSLSAVSIWSIVHGLAMLKLERRLPLQALSDTDETNMLRNLLGGLCVSDT